MASRRNFRYIVRDQYGYVIQNARVNLYQPDTTNAVVGTMFDAYSGGSSVTNPRTTNAQGEIEVWLDTPQRIDVAVDDNTDTAYRAVNGSSATVSFTSFTEQDLIVGAIANVDVVPVVSRTTAAAGTDDDVARADHIHGFMGSGRSSQFTLTNTTTETAIGYLALPANSVAAGSTFRWSFDMYSTNSTTQRAWQIRNRWGANGTPSAGVLLGGTLSITNSATAGTDEHSWFDGIVTVRTIGATGTAIGDIHGRELISGTTTYADAATGIFAASTIDTTAQKDLIVSFAFNGAGTDVTAKIDNFAIWQVA